MVRELSDVELEHTSGGEFDHHISGAAVIDGGSNPKSGSSYPINEPDRTPHPCEHFAVELTALSVVAFNAGAAVQSVRKGDFVGAGRAVSTAAAAVGTMFVCENQNR